MTSLDLMAQLPVGELNPFTLQHAADGLLATLLDASMSSVTALKRIVSAQLKMPSPDEVQVCTGGDAFSVCCALSCSTVRVKSDAC